MLITNSCTFPTSNTVHGMAPKISAKFHKLVAGESPPPLVPRSFLEEAPEPRPRGVSSRADCMVRIGVRGETCKIRIGSSSREIVLRLSSKSQPLRFYCNAFPSLLCLRRSSLRAAKLAAKADDSILEHGLSLLESHLKFV